LAPVWSRVSLSFCLLLGIAAATVAGYAQSAERLSQVKKLYIEPLGHSRGAAEIRSQIEHRLQKNSEVQVVSDLNHADAVMKGTGQIWTVGRSSLSPRPHSPTETVLQGFLSAEIVGRNNQTLWSYLVTPSKFPWGGISDDLARQLVGKLLADIKEKPPSEEAIASGALANAQVALTVVFTVMNWAVPGLTGTGSGIGPAGVGCMAGADTWNMAWNVPPLSSIGLPLVL